MEAIRKCEKEIKGLKSDVSDSKKQSTKALKKVETLEREIRQIRALLEGRETGTGASLKPRLSDESDIRQQVGIKCVGDCSTVCTLASQLCKMAFKHWCYIPQLIILLCCNLYCINFIMPYNTMYEMLEHIKIA